LVAQLALNAFRSLFEERGSTYIVPEAFKRIRYGNDIQRDPRNLLRLLSFLFRLISLSRYPLRLYCHQDCEGGDAYDERHSNES
jgi:hypothetical protein